MVACFNPQRMASPIGARLGLTLAMTLGVLAVPAHADDGSKHCLDAAKAWLASCPTTRDLELVNATCPTGGVVIVVEPLGGAPLRVEVTRSKERGFRRAGDLGISPVGEFTDWNREPREARDALDAVVACAETNPDVPMSKGELSPGTRALSGPRDPTPATPWLLFAGLTAMVATCALRCRRGGTKRALAEGALVAALWLGTWILRRLIHPWGFFHQNGQGPLWVELSLDAELDHLRGYGDGFRELTSFIAIRSATDPDHAVLLAISGLGACAAPATWLIARRASAPPMFAGALALLVALDPVLARVSQSESYYGITPALLFLACAVLMTGARRPRPLELGLAVVSAGLLIAQAARVHPVCWIAAATTPAVLLVTRGRLKTRLKNTVAAGLGIGAVVGLTTGGALYEVVTGPLGQQWTPSGPQLRSLSALWADPKAWTAMGLLALVTVIRERPKATIPLGLGAFVLGVVAFADVLANQNEWIHAAYFRLPAAVMVAMVAGWFARAFDHRHRWPATAGSTMAIGAVLATSPGVGPWMPTDVREQDLAFEWRSRLPRGSTVLYLWRVEKEPERGAGWDILRLPLYGQGFAGGSVALPFTPDDPPNPERLTGSVYYYRSSLCDTSSGREACSAMENAYRWVPVEQHQLPSIPSMLDSRYVANPVSLGVFRLERR